MHKKKEIRKFRTEQWPAYENQVSAIDHNFQTLNLEDKENKIVNHILESGKKCFKLAPGTICFPKRKPWWNAVCTRAVALKKRASNKWRHHPVRIHQLVYRNLAANTRRVIKREKKTELEKIFQ